MIQADVLKALNKQVNAELESAYIYLAMGCYLDDEGYSGMGSWLINHAKEEYEHAMKIRDFISDKDEKVTFLPIADPGSSWNGPLDVFEKIYAHEQLVSSMIIDIVKLAREKGDITAEVFLNCFIDEQVEEEKITRDIRDRIKLIGSDKGGLLTYDRFLAQEVTDNISDTAALNEP
ncbi:MAG: ferritin [Alphaproteobacteria bacterium]|nr:ferritin [Alphaproteobacteria bacterium]